MTITTEVICAVQPDNYLGETPLWSVSEQALYWVNCENPAEIHRWKPASGEHDIWPMKERVGGIVLKPGNNLLVVLSHGIYDFSPETAVLTLRLSSPLPDYVSLHECQCDRQGRLWVGAYDHRFTPQNRNAKDGAIFRLDGDKLIPEIRDISVANGLAFSPDGKTLYVADAPTRTVEAYDLNTETGSLSNGRKFLELKEGEGYLDGATVDTEGGYWLAAVAAGTLRRYLPDGSLDRVVQLPVSNPTKAAFGGAELDTLYVTTTKLKLGANSEENGGIYALQPGFKGLPEPIFAE